MKKVIQGMLLTLVAVSLAWAMLHSWPKAQTTRGVSLAIKMDELAKPVLPAVECKMSQSTWACSAADEDGCTRFERRFPKPLPHVHH